MRRLRAGPFGFSVSFSVCMSFGDVPSAGLSSDAIDSTFYVSRCSYADSVACN